ncbi:MAG: hypothetical protein MUF51_03715 [Vicinamibacteria bacterium]|jgi:hypothetical protein|nr:hypothetical protein [Vicinamibacteria bacterium]
MIALRKMAITYGLGAAGAWLMTAAPPPIAAPLTREHEHPSRSFAFKTPEGWSVTPLKGRPASLEVLGKDVRIWLHYQRGDQGLDATHVNCMAERMASAMSVSADVRFEYDFLSGAYDDFRILDSAFTTTYDRPIDGQQKWRQRNLTMVGGGHTLCVIVFTPLPVWKKDKQLRATVDEVIRSLEFGKRP